MNATATSKKNNTRPAEIIHLEVTKFKLPPFTKLINKCPATMLAASRTDKVMGRIMFLTSSIKTINGINALGVPEGTR